MNFGTTFDQGLGYEQFLDRYATAEQRRRWDAVHAQVRLSPAQQELLASFTRQMKVLVVAGAWCGDCIEQCPIFAHIEGANATIQIRYFDRDENEGLADELSICGGRRVPSVLFLSEDDHPCGRYGDRTLAKYRSMVGTLLGAACPTGLVAQDDALLAAVTQEWLDEFERIQWMLRTSGRLRQLHGD